MRQKTWFILSLIPIFITSAVYVWSVSINTIHLSSLRRPLSLTCFSELVNFSQQLRLSVGSCNFGSWVFEYQLVSRLADPSPFPAPYSSSPTWIDSKKRNLNLNISSHKYAIGDTQLTVHSCYWGVCRKKEEKHLNLRDNLKRLSE